MGEVADRRRRGEPFFLWAGTALAVIVIAGFGLNLVFEGQAVGPITPLVVLHGLLMVSWYVAFVFQGSLIGRGGVKLHRRLGTSSLALAAGVVLSGLWVMNTGFQRGVAMDRIGDAAFIVAFNLLNLTGFAILYGLGYLRRSRPEAHKRYMLMAGVAMTPPALGRLVASLGAPDLLALLILAGALAALPLYDRRVLNRVSGASWVGVAMVVSTIVIGLVVGSASWWPGVVATVLGA